MTAGGRLVVVTPIEPSTTGNGLAMRVDVLVEAAARHHEVHLVVVPVAGAPPLVAPETTVGLRTDLAPVRAGTHRSLDVWLAHPAWRERLARLSPLPDPVARMPLGAADDLATATGSPIIGVLACRLGTAMFGLRLAEAAGVPLVVDLDDDDEALARQRGDTDGAAAWHRLAAMVLDEAHLALAASDAVASDLRARHHGSTPLAVAPNAAPPPPPRSPPPASPPPPTGHRVLLVANYGYPPNRDAAVWLVTAVLPHLPRHWSIDLVGPGAPTVPVEAIDRVEVHGTVDDLAPHYRNATVAVAPLLSGSGTRIKILEAMAHQRPVVATTVAASGLELEPGHHALIADDPAAFAEAIVRCADPAVAHRLTEASRALLFSTYDRGLVIDRIARLLAEALTTDPGLEPTIEEHP